MTEKESVSALVWEETFHQKRRVPGPVTVVSMVVLSLFVMVPLWAAASASWVVLVWTVQGAAGSVFHGR